ncbi:MAG: hypothetical protein JWO51_4277 [Rhodospirillales bacterium]|nr:hypothetical protein [Rhodospirillales bacterium]
MWGSRPVSAIETYEIQALRNGYWQIAMAIDDGRNGIGSPLTSNALELLEKKVRAAAAAQLSVPGTQAVQVLCEKTRPDGSVTVQEFLRIDSQGVPARVLGLSPIRDAGPRCETPGGLLQRRSCHLIGTLLRGLLDELAVSPLELLTDERWQRRLQPHATLLASAVQKVAALQAGGDPRARAAALDALVEGAQKRARAAAAIAKLPELNADGVDMLLVRIKALGVIDGEFLSMRAMARHLRTAGSPLSKIERLLELLMPGLSAQGVALIDRFLAGLVEAPSMVKDLLGRQPNLGTALIALGEFAEGEAPATGKGDLAELARRLALPLAAKRLPDTRDALWDRVISGLLSSRSLAEKIREEWPLLKAIEKDLQPHAPDSRREALAAAVAERKLALRRAADQA